MDPEAGASGGTPGDDVELLTELLVTALGVPPDPADQDCAAGRMTAQLLVALARSGARDVVGAALGLGLGEDVDYEVRRFGGDGSVTSVAGPMAATDAVLTAASLVTASHEALNVVACGLDGGDRCVLARGTGGSLVHRSTSSAPWPSAVGAPPAPPAPVAPLAPPAPPAPPAPVFDLEGALRDVLAGTTVEVDLSGIDEAVRAAVAGAIEQAQLAEPPASAVVPVDADEIARVVIARLVEDRRAPRTYDLTDIIGSLVPTPVEVADVVAHQLGDLVASAAGGSGAASAAALAELTRQVGAIADGLNDARAAHELLARQMSALAREIASTCSAITSFESRLIG